MNVSDSRRFTLAWLVALAAVAVAGAVISSGHSFVEPVFLFGSPIDVIVNTAVVIVCSGVAVGFTVVGVRMWADRRKDQAPRPR